jgi:KipI family sensor histidine kinase inhibitor
MLMPGTLPAGGSKITKEDASISLKFRALALFSVIFSAMKQWTRYGPHAWLLRFAETIEPASLLLLRRYTTALELNPPKGLREFVPGFGTLLFLFHLDNVPANPKACDAFLMDLESTLPKKLPEPPLKKIPVVYDGPDLADVAKACTLDPGEVVALHSAPVYTVCFLGFAPGFPYLAPLDARLHLPRRAIPRTAVPAGSVAIGGEHTGIYPIASPGGWHLLGRTEVPLFNPREQGSRMFFLQAGDQVKFEPL